MIRLRNPLNVMSRRAFHALTVVEALQRAGCQVLEAHAHVNPPMVRVDRRPPGIDTYGFVSPPPGCVRVPVLCTASHWGARIQWINKEPNQ